MCSLSENLLNASLSVWLRRDFVTARVITRDEFHVQINGLIEEFKRTISNELILLFKLMQVTNLANQLATTESSNWEFIVNPIYNVSSINYIGSTLIYYAKPFPIKTLIPSSSSSSNRTVESILAEFFVEEWVPNVSFDRYYEERAPKLCQYSHSAPFNGIYFLTKTLSILGGLSKILRKRRVAPYPTMVGPNTDDVTLNTIPNVPITTLEINADPIQEQIEPRSNNRTDRIIAICLCLLVIVTIVVASVISTGKRDTKYISITTLIATLITTTEITESTTTSTGKHTSVEKHLEGCRIANLFLEICYMTLIYQSKTYPIGLDANSFILGDLNGDSFLDLAVTNYGNDTFSISFGDENGAFQPQQVYSTGYESYPWGIASGHFNNDTFLDI
ncbi:unnamed protein product, partial [Adineta steineri]